MDVVAAGVHDAGVQRFVGEARLLPGPAGRPYPPGRRWPARASPPEDGHDPGLGDASADLEAEGLELGGDQTGRLDLAVAQLGVHVDEAPDLDDLALVFFDLGVDAPLVFGSTARAPARTRPGRRGR